MESKDVSVPPQVPPKKTKRPSIPDVNASGTNNSAEGASELTNQEAEPMVSAINEDLRSLEDMVQNMMGSIAELDELSANRVVGNSQTGSADNSDTDQLMTTSLPVLPSQASAVPTVVRPTPTPRVSTRKTSAVHSVAHPPADTTLTNPPLALSRKISPKPTPRARWRNIRKSLSEQALSATDTQSVPPVPDRKEGHAAANVVAAANAEGQQLPKDPPTYAEIESELNSNMSMASNLSSKPDLRASGKSNPTPPVTARLTASTTEDRRHLSPGLEQTTKTDVVPRNVRPQEVLDKGRDMLPTLTPRTTIPGNTAPISIVPGSTAPSSVVPSSVVPSSAVSGNSVPSSIVPGNAVPSSVVPSSAVPGNTARSSTAVLNSQAPSLALSSTTSSKEVKESIALPIKTAAKPVSTNPFIDVLYENSSTIPNDKPPLEALYVNTATTPADEAIYDNTSNATQLLAANAITSTSSSAATTITPAPTDLGSEAIYDNTSNGLLSIEIPNTLRKIDMRAVPIPSYSSEPFTPVTPLSSESLSLLDPTAYMSLWELQGAKSSSATGGSSVQTTTTHQPLADLGAFAVSALTRSVSVKKVGPGPPIPPRLSEGNGSSGIATPADQREATDSFEHTEFPFPSVPSADRSSFLPPPTSKLIPRRPAPLAPPKQVTNTTAVTEGSPVITTTATDLYSQIDKTAKPAATVISDEDHNPYCLAEEIPAWFVNAAVSYDSEDTVDEDSDLDNTDQPTLPPKILPVAASPRTAQKNRQGYLYKQGGKQNNKGWRKRYVTFDGDRLRYFSSEKSRISKRIIPVQVVRCVENDVKDCDSGKFRFRVVTLNRVYMFAAETLEDHHFWTHILMQAVILFNKQNSRGSIGLGMMRGGTMHTPDLEGSVKLDDVKKYLAIKDGKLCYYNNENDYQFATPIHEVSLNTASVKDIGKCKLQLTNPYHTYILSFDSDSDLESWKIALEDGIAAALSDDNVLNEVYGNSSNRICADCSGLKPHWAVLHLSSVVCSYCAGIHRQYWPFKVKSLRMDVKVWTKSLIDLYVAVGNETINSVWEAKLSSSLDKISSSANSSQRQAYIIKKYLKKAFFPSTIYSLSTGASVSQLNQELYRSIQRGIITDVIFLINRGASISHPTTPSNQTPLQLAESSNQPHIAQYLKQNGAENESYNDIWAVMRKQLDTDPESDDKNVIKSGHLYKIMSSKKETYPCHWLVLTTKSLKCYDEEFDPEPKVTIPCRSIINLCRIPDRGEPCFEMTCNRGGHSYLYGAEDADTIYQWMTAIHKLVTASSKSLDLDLEFAKAGYVHCKRGSLGHWKLCWLQNKKKKLYVIDSDISWSEEIDLRKVLKLSLVIPDETTAAGPGEEGGAMLVLYMSDHYIYIQSDLKHETEKWHQVIDHACKETSHNLEDQQLNKDNVPVLIEKCIEFISLHGMTMEGIYRLSGTHSKVTNLLQDFLNGARSVHLRLEESTVHDVANVLKRFLRNLQEPVMSSQLYGEWLGAAMLTKQSIESSVDRAYHDQKLNKYKELLERLPAVNFATLKMIIGHLNRVSANQAENKMSQTNLSTLFGPVLLSGSSTENPTQQAFYNTNFEIQLADEMMTYYKWLFSVNEAEMEIEDKIQAKIEEMKKMNPHAAAPSGEFILGIYIYNNMGEPINTKVPAQKTAKEIVADVASMKRIPRADGYSLFEVVCSGELERPLTEHEKVLSATLALSHWSAEHRKGNYLCVKEDTIRDSIEHSSGRDISRFTELQFSDKKGWKKMYFELTSSQLICYRDRNNNKVNEWNITDICIYIGVERKRKPPTAFGVTFLASTDDKSKYIESHHLGRSVCFTTGDEMLRWLSSIYYTQNHDKTPPSSMNPSVRTPTSGQSEKSAVALLKKAASPKFRNLPASIKRGFKR